jgi:Ca2+-binding RTX toxin-like protein
MAKIRLNWLDALQRKRQTRRPRSSFQERRIESLEERAVPAVIASFSPSAGGTLVIFGDALDNTIDVSRDAAGVLKVNSGSVSILGGTPTVANTSLIQIFSQGGNDTISLTESIGLLPAALLFGGDGNDTLTGGSGADQLFGQAGNDTLLGKGGADKLFGGDGDDVLTGGTGDDLAFGQSGKDRMIWNPGDGTDLNEGGDGIDTVEVNGGNGAEFFTATVNGSRVRFDRVSPGPFSIDIGTSENLVLNANGGNDSFTSTGNLAALIKIRVDGGAGDDTILGGNGADVLLGGDGNDFIDGNQANDTISLGAGDDVFQWDPGDGSDSVDGQAGIDRMIFNGANTTELFDVSANGDHVRFTRNVGGIVMDLNDIENIDLNALGEPDTITIGDLHATDLLNFKIALSASIGGATGDTAADHVIVRGTNGKDTIGVTGANGAYTVTGLSLLVSVTQSEAIDTLEIDALGGDDSVNAFSLLASVTTLTVDAGTGNDRLLGSRGDDILLGGDGNDFIDGVQGNDFVQMGAGDDVFQWDPGDGNDTVNGQAGIDKMVFNGSSNDEDIDISANDGRVRLFRNVANVTMDTDDLEVISLNVRAGVDHIAIHDLSGTDLTKINLDLAATEGSGIGDGSSDTVTIDGTNGNDAIIVNKIENKLAVTGLPAMVNILAAESAKDQLTINGLGGADVIDASPLKVGAIGLTLNGGLGDDLLKGSAGNDMINGGDGDDLALMGSGDDVFVWNPGDDNDTIEGQAGIDKMRFNGAIINENIDISSNGSRVRFARNIGSVTMDLNGIEAIDFNALGGSDKVVVHDLSGTNLTDVNLNLADNNGAPDTQLDQVIIDATNNNDVLLVTGDLQGVSTLGLAARVSIAGFDANLDQLVLSLLAGDDVLEASGLAANTISLIADGGEGDDVLIGSAGNDRLLGAAGDDVLIGNGGTDVLDGGPGSNVVI